jgi:hypothetical protein
MGLGKVANNSLTHINLHKTNKQVVALVERFPTMCRMPPTCKGIGLISDFPWSGVKLPI